jgi:AraC-like DNA-binding protein
MKSIPVRRITPAGRDAGLPGRFSIRAIEDVLAGKDLVHELHKHDFYFILAVQQGAGLHEIDFVPYEIKDRTIFILRPGQVHKLSLNAGATGFLLEFDLDAYRPKFSISEARWQKAISRNACRPKPDNFMALNALLAHVHTEFAGRQEGYLEAIRATLDLFFIGYVRQSPDPKGSTNAIAGYTQERFDELLRLLEANVGRWKQVSDYASRMHLSPYQLNTIAKASVGKTVSALIQEQLILEAKRNLLATSSQVKDIADGLGFEDVSYFIRFFRKHTGHAPEAFRRLFT